MMINPQSWANGIVKFSEKPYFHLFEILSRLGFGLGFIIYAEQTIYPTLITYIGYLLVAVSIGLSLTPPSKHKQCAVWSASRFRKTFRLVGFVSIFFGVFLIYAAIQTRVNELLK
jgi:hypothetical protein